MKTTSFARLIALSLFAGHVPLAHAQTARLSVERSEGAGSCPEASALEQQITRMGGPDTSSSRAYQVLFEREDQGFRATIQPRSSTVSSDGGQRVLRARGPTCAALSQATAVALALLFDPDTAAPEPDAAPAPAAPQPTAAAAPPPPPTAAAPTLDLPPAIRIEPVRLSFALGGSAAIGVIAPVAAAVHAELGVQHSAWRAGAGVHWLPARDHELASGRVRESLVSAAIRGCYALLRTPSELRLELCSGAFLGSLHAAASGFSRDGSSSEPWLAIPAELALAQLGNPLGWELSASALFPVRHHDFEIKGAGVAYHSPRVAALLTLRALAAW